MTTPSAALLGDGTAPGVDDWLRAAAAVLRKSGRLAPDGDPAQVWELLSRRTIDGLPIPPLGTPAGSVPPPGVPGRPPFLRGAEVLTQGWDIRTPVADPDPARAGATVLADLAGGATSLWITVGDGGTALADLPTVLDGVYLDLAPVVLSVSGAVSDLGAAQALAGLLRDRGVRPHPATNLGADPIGRTVRGSGTSIFAGELGEIAAVAGDLGIRGVVVDGLVAHEAGAGETGVLGYLLAAGAAVLRELAAAGVDLDTSLNLLEFRLPATDEQFTTIALFRAARLLWDRVAELSGAAAERPGQRQHAVTSWPMMTRYDSWTNLLRTTIAAFAAGVGGAQSVTVLPFDSALGLPDPVGYRLARNISHLLIAESHVAAAADPAGGAAAVEALTWTLAEAGWAEFERIEAAGGVRAAAADGSLRQGWAATAVTRQRQLATRRRPIVGVSEYPQLAELLPARRPRTALAPPRWSTPFETLRDAPGAAEVFLATLGPVAAHNARATFTTLALAAGGVGAVTAGPTASVAEVLDAYAAAGSPAVVCLVGTDQAYGESAASVAQALRDAGASRIILAGKPSGSWATVPDDHLAAGEDLLAFLDRTRSALADSTPVIATASPKEPS